MADLGPEIAKVIEFMPYLRQLYGEGVDLVVTDLETYVWRDQGRNKNMGAAVGERIKEGSLAETAIRTGRRVAKRIGGDVYGGAGYIGSAVPIREEDGRIAGTILVVDSTEAQDAIHKLSQKLGTAVEGISGGAAGFAASAEELSTTSSELAGNTDRIKDDVKDMNEIIDLIMEIASQTHLLGLNAAIEAARAGDAGRGFNVVAEEIRKLAGRTQTSAKDVAEKLGRIKANIDGLAEHVLQVSSVSQEQAATSGQISADIQELVPMAGELIRMSAELGA